MEQRIKFVARALQPGVSLTQLCAAFGVSRTTGYRWVDRYREVGHSDWLVAQSRRPHTSPERTAAAVEARVMALRQQYGWGADKLQRLLRNEGLDVKRSTLNRLNAQGCLNYNRRRYFVCEALATESVGIEEVEQTLLISYRHMYIREIDTQTGWSRPVVRPTKPR
jgi:transposase